MLAARRAIDAVRRCGVVSSREGCDPADEPTDGIRCAYRSRSAICSRLVTNADVGHDDLTAARRLEFPERGIKRLVSHDPPPDG
jgi:hypothetical protein